MGVHLMVARGGTENGDGREDRGQHAGRMPGLTVVSHGDRLEYIADMVQELRTMSAAANCQKLAGLLDQAYREAQECRRGG